MNSKSTATVPPNQGGGKGSWTPLTDIERQQIEDLDWASQSPEVQQHSGMFVVIHKKRIVGVGTDRAVLIEEASQAEQCPSWELVVDVVPPSEPEEIPK